MSKSYLYNYQHRYYQDSPGITDPLPGHITPGRCKYCGKPILWRKLITKTGKPYYLPMVGGVKHTCR